MINPLLKRMRLLALAGLLSIPYTQALALGIFDSDLVWPLCGRITENPPNGWQAADGCPLDRWGNPNYSDTPISSTFGPRQLASENFRYDFHRSLDIAAPIGTPLFALTDGIVQKAGNDPGYTDPLVQLRHYRPGFTSCTSGGGCYYSNYLHISAPAVQVGDTVSKGQLIGYTGASSDSGFAHVHLEIRDAPPQDPFSNWSRDAVHPLTALPYHDHQASNIDLTLDSVDTGNPNNPIITATVTIPFSTELDLEKIETEAYEWQSDGSLARIPQPGETAVGNTIEQTGYWVDPPFYSMLDFNRQYSYKDSSSIPWSYFETGGIYQSPYHDILPASYDPNIHLDAQDPYDPQIGSFNGWKLAPNHTNANSSEYVLRVENHALIGADNADNLCIKIRAKDVHGSATDWQTWNCDNPPDPPDSFCGDNTCDVGESCDGRNSTLSCPTDCPGKTSGKPNNRYCNVKGFCEGPGCA